jgi:hypothetical protein
MNPFVLGKLAEIRIQDLVDFADELRTARRAPRERRPARRTHHVVWFRKRLTTSLCGAMTR